MDTLEYYRIQRRLTPGDVVRVLTRGIHRQETETCLEQ